MPETTTTTAKPWFHRLTTTPAGLTGKRCYCFPYAGGTVAAFHPLARQAAAARFDIRVASLPGRGVRLSEPPETDLRRLIATLTDAVQAANAGSEHGDFVFFGHSMGALVAFEVARELRRRSKALPTALIVSGARAPQRFDREKIRRLHALPREAFLAHLRTLDGTPKEVLDIPDLMDFMLPPLRGDFALCGSYHHTEDAPFDFPLLALAGDQDREAAVEDVLAWRHQAPPHFSSRIFTGGHFFINDHWSAIAALISDLPGSSPEDGQGVCIKRGSLLR